MLYESVYRAEEATRYTLLEEVSDGFTEQAII